MWTLTVGHVRRAEQKGSSAGIRPFCLGAISTVTRTPCMVVVTTSDAFSKALMTLFSVALNLISGACLCQSLRQRMVNVFLI
jgi:hypothetical protein